MFGPSRIARAETAARRGDRFRRATPPIPSSGQREGGRGADSRTIRDRGRGRRGAWGAGRRRAVPVAGLHGQAERD
jgi:hypothetical protein